MYVRARRRCCRRHVGAGHASRLSRSLVGTLLLLVLLTSAAIAAPSSQETLPGVTAPWPLLTGGLAFLVPLGFALIAAAGLPDNEARQVTLATLAAFVVAVLGYWACGFALQFGGIGLVQRQNGLEGLIWEWSALDVSWGTGWGMAGLHGFGLTGAASTDGALALFLSNLPWVATATLIPLLVLRGRAPTFVAALGGLIVGACLYPLAGNWIWGGGWLANLGYNLGLGHGFVDFAGSGLVHLLGAAMAAAGIVTFLPRRPRTPIDEPVPLPPVHLPLLATVGGVLLLIGSLAWASANPLLEWDTLRAARLMANIILAAGAGVALPLAYTWFVSNRPDPLMAVRGLAAALVAICASAPFVAPGAALVIGAIAGLLTPMVCYLVDHVLHWNDPTAALTVNGLGSVWGLMALALFADGSAGRGWNAIGASEYMSVPGQGVSGLLTASGFLPDWPGQLQAQAVGLATIGLFSFVVTGLTFGALSGICHLAGRRRARVTEVEDEIAGWPQAAQPVQADDPAGAEEAGETSELPD
jgi:Amt family ammonium transporter